MLDDPKRIACVEDEPDIRELTRLALEAIGGFEVAVYPSGPEALDRLPNEVPDVILLDVMMPEMDGPAVLDRLARLAPLSSVPVIFMTARARREEVQQLMRLGAIGVISKPYDPMTLADEIRTLCRAAA